MPNAKPQPAPDTAAARTASRRAEWKIVVADSFDEAEAKTRAYWRAATPAERLNALKKLREPFYGKDQIGGRLRDFLKLCLRNEVRFMAIGGYAVIHHSRPATPAI